MVNKPSTSISTASPLVDTVERLIKFPVEKNKVNNLIKKIDGLIDISIENEMMYASFIKDGAVYQNKDTGEIKVSDTAMSLHKINKANIPELIKVKRLLEDSSTENVDLRLKEDEAVARWINSKTRGDN